MRDARVAAQEYNPHTLTFGAIYNGFRRESAALWFLCFYILVEYLRPQQMYKAIDILPWGQLSIVLCFASVFVTKSRSTGANAMDKMFIAISLLVILSGFMAWDPAISWKYWSTYASWMLMYFCIVSILNSPHRMLLFVIAFIVINFKLSQHGARSFATRGFGFAKHGLSGAGWFHNSGELALQMVVMFAMSLSLLMGMKRYITSNRRWQILILLFPATAALTVIGSSSRGGQLALAAVVFLFFMKNKNFVRNVLALAIVGYIGFSFLPETQKARFTTMGDDRTSELRLLHWGHAWEVIKEEPFGIGYRNWSGYYEANFDVELVEQIHNSSLEAFVDLGYLGGALVHVAILMSLIMNRRTRREMQRFGGPKGDAMASIAHGLNLALIGTFIAAMFMSVLFYPMFWVSFALSSALRKVSLGMLKNESAAKTDSWFVQSKPKAGISRPGMPPAEQEKLAS
ncbi:MAG: O-antigen ligase family protein [Pseudomonadota bacterium]